MSQDPDIKKAMCGRCKYILGMTDRDHLSIKAGDIFIYIYGGLAIICCKLCHALNLVVDDEYEKAHPEKVEQATKMLNSVKATFGKWYPNKAHGPRHD